MKDYKFETQQEYLEWCAKKVSTINYAMIAMSDLRWVLEDINSTLHLSEGQRLIK